MKTYILPKFDLTSVFDAISKLEHIIPEEEFVFDFTNVRVCDPLPMLLVGAGIRRFTEKHPNTYFAARNFNHMSYAGTMGFFKYMAPKINIGKRPGEAKGSNSYIPITEINVSKLSSEMYDQGIYLPLGNIIERKAATLSQVVDRGNPELHKLLTYLLREIIRNIPEHAHTNTLWVCGQYWPTYELAEIAIIDEGIGIYKSLTNNATHRQYINNNAQALQWALKAGISTTFRPSYSPKDDDTWTNSGFGLYMVSKICKELNGSFCIASHNDYIIMGKNDEVYGKTFFNGTAISLRISTKGILNAQNILNKLSEEGEAEAKTIRTAFKSASTPSKGLMEQLNII